MPNPKKNNGAPLPPEYKKLIEQAEALNNLGKVVGFFARFGVGGKKAKSFAKKIEELNKQQRNLLSVMTRFNEVFQPLGWIMSESRNIDTAKAALDLADAGNAHEAEALLAADFEGENLDFLTKRFWGVKVLRQRENLISEAVALCHEKRYLAAVPLILIIADGAGQDYFGKAIFSEGTDLTELNAIAGHESGLLQMTREFAKTRRKFNDQEITIPYRNGIIHGRDVNYGNRLVAAKAWAYLSCVADVIRAREDALAKPPEPEPTLRESVQKYKETKAQKKLIEEWKPRPLIMSNWQLSSQTDIFDPESPEANLAAFLKAWQSKNFGMMGEKTVYFDNRPVKKRAGKIREDMKDFILNDAKIVKIKDDAAAVTEIDCELTFHMHQETLIEPYTFRMIYGDDHSSPLLRGHKNGSWKVIPNYQGWVFTLSAKTREQKEI